MKKTLAVLGFLLASLPLAGRAADNYPSRPIRLIVGFAPGGATDQIARLISAEMSKSLGQSIVVENRSGAGSTIASGYVARSAADGYTLLVGLSNLYRADNYMYPSALFDGAKDFTPISNWATGPMVIVANKDLGVSNLRELIAKAKQSKKALFYATAGTGRVTHYAGVAFGDVSGVKLEAVAFKGGAPAIMSVVAGDTQLAFATPPSVMPMVSSGQLKAISVTSAKRSRLFPQIPGIDESGLHGYDLTFWIGLFAPAGLPEDVRTKLYKATQKALSNPDVREKIIAQGMEVSPSPSSAAFADFYKQDGERTYELVKASMPNPQ